MLIMVKISGFFGKCLPKQLLIVSTLLQLQSPPFSPCGNLLLKGQILDMTHLFPGHFYFSG